MHLCKDCEVREKLEEEELERLSDQAVPAADSRGREEPESADGVRTCFQVDRDRILHSPSFRRLKFKTQVFIEPVRDDARTRLTHTLEVMQISRTVARALHLNEDLTEAISLGHDLGHTPFAHVGESVLDRLSDGGFHHSNQSLRVVDYLANRGRGLNLTREVRDGIARHSKPKKSMFESIVAGSPLTLEATIVRYCDSIAYLNHDIDDALKAGYLNKEDIPDKPRRILGEKCSERIDRSVRDMIKSSRREGEIVMSESIARATDELRDFMFENLYLKLSNSPVAAEARRLFASLYKFLKNNPDIIYEEKPFLENVDSQDIIADFFSLESDLSTIKLYRKYIDKQSFEHLPELI
ncbi:MAG: deoxyguanosinetriphosphate triphosphohydrolase [bacterium]